MTRKLYKHVVIINWGNQNDQKEKIKEKGNFEENID